MKNLLKKIQEATVKVVAIATIALTSIVANAAATPPTPVDCLRGRSVWVAGSSATNIYGPLIRLMPGGVLSYQSLMAATNSTTANMTLVWRFSNTPTLSPTSPNWSTAGTSTAAALAGTAAVNTVGSITNAAQPIWAQLWYVTNASAATGGAVLTNVWAVPVPSLK